MSLSSLIHNQTIKIDNHKRGVGVVNNWKDTSSDIHIHKTAHDNKNKYVIRVPLNTSQPVSVSVYKSNKLHHNCNVVPQKIQKEVNKALNNPDTRDKFFTDVIRTLSDYNWPGSSQKNDVDIQQEFNDLVGRIASAFNLDVKGRVIPKWSVEKLKSLTCSLIDSDKKIYSLNINENYLRLGQRQPRKKVE